MTGPQLTSLENKLERARPVDLRRCLRCDHWMRSTGADHRICNPCRGYCGGTDAKMSELNWAMAEAERELA